MAEHGEIAGALQGYLRRMSPDGSRHGPKHARLRGALLYVAGVAAGFLVPVLPFAALAPRAFYHSVVVAQLVRIDTVRTALSYRLHQMTGLNDFTSLGPVPKK